MAIYDPEKGVYFEGGRTAYPIIGVELHANGLTIITIGGVRDDIERWSVKTRYAVQTTHRGVVLSEGNKTPLFYPERNQIIIESTVAHQVWMRMIGQAVTDSPQMEKLPRSFRETALVLKQIVPGFSVPAPVAA